jgi:hypothetical protein
VSLSCAEILDVWEVARDLPAAQRALAMWAAAGPDCAVAELAIAPIGRRDAALAALRRALYGTVAECFLECPGCKEPLEFPIDLSALDVPPDDGSPGEIACDVWTCRYRLPTTEDLVALAGSHDADEVRRELLARCVIELRRAGDLVPSSALPSQVAGALEAEMARRDPNADIRLMLTCASCSHAWSSTFDIASFLWRELERDAARLLRQVDVLARVYGWSESQVLSLSRARRRAYLDLVSEG